MSSAQEAPAPSVAVRIYKPSEALEGYVTFFYFVDVSGPLTDFLYPEWGNVRFAISGDWRVQIDGYPAPSKQEVVLFGPTDRPGTVTTGGGKTIGFGLTPIGWHRLIHGHACELTNRIAPLGQHLGCDGETLRKHLISDGADHESIERLETVLLKRISEQPPVSDVVLAADRALRMRPLTVGDFADAAGLSERTLYRLCMQTFGFAPKRLMRLQRFLDTLGHVRTAVGESVISSMSDDYFDQAHFYRDFRDFMSMSPRAYFSAPRHLMAAAAEAQMRAGVTLSFRLPPQPGRSAAE